jgi:hypothetical protein
MEGSCRIVFHCKTLRVLLKKKNITSNLIQDSNWLKLQLHEHMSGVLLLTYAILKGTRTHAPTHACTHARTHAYTLSRSLSLEIWAEWHLVIWIR